MMQLDLKNLLKSTYDNLSRKKIQKKQNLQFDI